MPISYRGLTDESEILKFLQHGTLVGLLPVPHPILIRKYQANNGTTAWFRTYMWGVIYLRFVEKMWNMNYPLKCSSYSLEMSIQLFGTIQRWSCSKFKEYKRWMNVAPIFITKYQLMNLESEFLWNIIFCVCHFLEVLWILLFIYCNLH